MQLNFSVSASVFSGVALSKKNKMFPADVINRVIVCNKEGCSYAHITKIENGNFDVEFELKPIDKNVKLCNSLKFHFYTGNKVPLVIAAGEVSMGSIIRLMKGKDIDPVQINCNFSPVFVQMHFHPPKTPLTVSSVPKFENSCLNDSDTYARIITLTNNYVSGIIKTKLNLETNIGAPMFCNLMSAHNFSKQVTTHIDYQQDVTPTVKNGKLFYKSGLTMCALAETHLNLCLTPEQVMKMPLESKEFTNFVANVCQSFMRSAHICPYVSDTVLDSKLDSSGNVHEILSESFKLPLHEPFPENATYLCADDCEGQATFMLHLFHSFGYLHAKQNSKTGLFKHFEVAMPANLFKMNDEEKAQLWKVAMKIGSCVNDKKLECHVTLVCAGGASLGDSSSSVGGHATCVLVNNTIPEKQITQIMEGTNSMLWDDDNTTLDLSNPMIPLKMPLVQVANMLTTNIAKIMGLEQADDPDFRKLIHLNSDNEQKFYKTAYCQNGNLLASNVANSLKLDYGIGMNSMSDQQKKVLMPVTPSLINSLVQNDKAHSFCNEHRIARRDEIHPPLMSKEKLSSLISHWSPLVTCSLPELLTSRKYKICMAMRSIRDKDERNEFAMQLHEKLNEWNNKYSDVGICTSYVAMDTVFTRLHMWTDDIAKLQSTLKSKMAE